MNLTELPVPNNLATWRRNEVARLREKLSDPEDVYEREGALWWRSNDRPVPPHVFKDAYLIPPEAQQAIHAREQEIALEAYRKARANLSPEQRAEEAAERRAAFGPGEEVIDIITGERFRT